MKKILLLIIALIVLASTSFAASAITCGTYSDVTFTNITNQTTYDSGFCFHTLNLFEELYFNETVTFNGSVVSCDRSADNKTITCTPVADGSSTVQAFVTNGSDSTQVTANIVVAFTPQPLTCSNNTIVELTHPHGNTSELTNINTFCNNVGNHTISSVVSTNNSVLVLENKNTGINATATSTGTATVSFTVGNEVESQSVEIFYNVTEFTNPVATPLAEVCGDLTQQNLTHPNGNTTWQKNATQFCSGTNYTVSDVVINNNSMAFCQTEFNNTGLSCVATQVGNFTLNFTVEGSTITKNYSVPFVVTNFTTTANPVIATESCLNFTQQNLTHPNGNTTWMRNTSQFCTGGNFTVSDVIINNNSMAFCQAENNNTGVSCIATLTGNFTLNFTASSNSTEYNYSVPFVVSSYVTPAVTNNKPICGTTSYNITSPDGTNSFVHNINQTCSDTDLDNITIVEFNNTFSTVSCTVENENTTLSCDASTTGVETIFYTVSDGDKNTTANLSITVTSFTQPTNNGGGNNNNNNNGGSATSGGTGVVNILNLTQTDDTESNQTQSDDSNAEIITNEDVVNQTVEVIDRTNSTDTNASVNNTITAQFTGENNTAITIGIIVLILALIATALFFIFGRNKK